MNLLPRNQPLWLGWIGLFVIGVMIGEAPAQVMMQNNQILIKEENVVSWIFGNSSRTLDDVEPNLNFVL
ncbi:MAG: hypothetical protein HUJ26_07310, partial [Planctomycetaceae bacterium]|nr:hypothetical protein [Planctomycetaceae bacterium]